MIRLDMHKVFFFLFLISTFLMLKTYAASQENFFENPYHHLQLMEQAPNPLDISKNQLPTFYFYHWLRIQTFKKLQLSAETIMLLQKEGFELKTVEKSSYWQPILITPYQEK